MPFSMEGEHEGDTDHKTVATVINIQGVENGSTPNDVLENGDIADHEVGFLPKGNSYKVTDKDQGQEEPLLKPDENNAGEEIEEEDKKEKEEKKEPPKLVSLGQLFQFADCGDVMLMLFGSIAAMANGCTHPVSFIVFGKLVSKFIEHGTKGTMDQLNIEDEMKTFAIYYVIIAGAMLLFSYVQCAFWALAGVRQTQRIRTAFFEAMMRQEIGWFDVNESGGLTTRLSDDILKIQTGIGDKVGGSIQYITMFFAGFGVGFYYGWKLTLVILALSPLLIICAAVMGKIMGNFTSQEQTAYARAGAIAEEVISSIRTVAAFGGEQKEIARYSERLVDAEKAGIKKGITLGGTFGAFHIVIFSTYALAFWYGSTLVADGEYEGGDLLIVFFCVMIGAAQVGQASPNFEALANARGAAYFVYDVIKRQSLIDPFSEEGLMPEELVGDISFNDVHFTYPSRQELKILDGFSLKIQRGSTVALVGESGCGKSTVVKLVQRFYDPDPEGGMVTIDSNDIRSLNVAWLRRHIGVVSQEPSLFEMSIADNIRMGRSNATQEEIEEAAKMANCHNFIKELPKQYETNVGEGGAQLSGGQKQRIAIARALVRDPKILLLDEATSALDTESESIVQGALDNASKGRTTIIIAHRLSTVRNADLIAAVKDGQVAEIGTHDDLMARKGVYYQLVMLQAMAEEEEHDLEETGSILSESEKEALVQAKLMRSLSQMSHASDKEAEVAAGLKRSISHRQSVKIQREKSVDTQRQDSIKPEKEEDEDEQVDPAPILRILKENKPELHLLIIGSFFSAIVGGFPVVFAIIISELLGVFTQSPDKIKDEATKWSLGFLALGGADALGLFVSAWLFAIAGERLTKRMRLQAFTSMLRQDISYFDDPINTTGHLTARLATDASNVKGAAATRLNIMVQVVVMALASIIVAFIYSWKLTLLILCFVPFLMLGGALQMKVFQNFAAEGNKMLVDASAIGTQAVMNIRTVASLGQERYFFDRFQELINRPYRKSLLKAHVLGITFGFSFANMMFANAAAFRLGGKLVQDKEQNFEDMFKVVFATTFGAMVSGQIASMAPDFLQAKISAARIFKLLDRMPAIDIYSPEGLCKSDFEGQIRFSEVEFNYPARPDVAVLQGLDLDIPVGKTVALVGSSGCGKSTSVGLIERFYDTMSGVVYLDGIDIKTYNLKWLRSQIGIVSQEPVLFAKSIRDNILYGVEEADLKDGPQAAVEAAAKAANIDGFICGLPKGYETTVGEKGTLISGGQKQRIAIARALIRNPKIMLLDEATSALDSESEKVVQVALEKAMEGRTSIVIAHRLSTIQNADVIAVIQGGKVIEMGTHQELIAKKGAYYVLNAAQM